MDRKKLISRALDSLSVLQHEIAVVANMSKLADDLEAEFRETKAALETANNELANATRQTAHAKAELADAQGERKQIEKEVLELRDEHRRLATEIGHIRKRLAAAEAA